MKLIFTVLLFFLPWKLRRRLLVWVLKYDIHPSARIGYSIVLPRRLFMGPDSSIGHFTVVKGLEELHLASHARLGHINWVTGFPLHGKRFFSAFPNRYPALVIEEHAAIHHRNLVDCTDRITVGRFSRVAGWWHQFLTHSIDLTTANQASAPIKIGSYCFIGTGAILLKGSALPDYSVLAAGAVLHKAHTDSYFLYSGMPAAPVKQLDPSLAFFSKTKGTSD